MKPFLRVRNWKKFQHYKQRNPPWIRLYNELLDDYAFTRLQDASKWHAVGVWLLASRFDNLIPDDAKWIGQRISARSPVDIDTLVNAGFLERCGDASGALAERKQVAKPETEAETEESRDEPLGSSIGFDEFWSGYPKRTGGNPKRKAEHAWNARIHEGADPSAIIAGRDRYAEFMHHEGKIGTPYVMQAATFLGPDCRWADDWTVRRNGNSADEKLMRHRQELENVDLSASRSIFDD